MRGKHFSSRLCTRLFSSASPASPPPKQHHHHNKKLSQSLFSVKDDLTIPSFSPPTSSAPASRLDVSSIRRLNVSKKNLRMEKTLTRAATFVLGDKATVATLLPGHSGDQQFVSIDVLDVALNPSLTKGKITYPVQPPHLAPLLSSVLSSVKDKRTGDAHLPPLSRWLGGQLVRRAGLGRFNARLDFVEVTQGGEGRLFGTDQTEEIDFEKLMKEVE